MKKILFVIIVLTTCINFYAQETQDIDPSKPTNLYTQINTLGEVSLGNGFNTYGSRINFQYAFNPDNLILAEVPLLYNDATQSFGLSDVRVRYFHALKRYTDQKVFAIAPFADVTMPTGDAQKGLGADTWSLAGGVVVGVMLSEKASLFPGLSYVYLTEPEISGVGLQTNLSYSFSKRTFLFVNPIATFLENQTIWTGEFNLNHIVTPNKFKINIGWYPNFTNEIHAIRGGATFFL
ncbi:MAG: hypothetical protein Tsb0033_24260 [Winogradskyella sp.]